MFKKGDVWKRNDGSGSCRIEGIEGDIVHLISISCNDPRLFSYVGSCWTFNVKNYLAFKASLSLVKSRNLPDWF